MKNNRKSYSDNLRSARGALERKLSDRYGHTVKVQILADLFEVVEEEWKNAVEGRMGRLKFSLVTEPQYAHDAAVLFREMKQFEEVDLINTKAIADSNPKTMDDSLYEAVQTGEKYVEPAKKNTSWTHHQVPLCGGIRAGAGWCDAGLLLLQQLYFPPSEEKRLYYKCLHWRKSIQSKACRI